MDSEQLIDKALRVTETNLTSGVWTLDTAKLFLSMAEIQPNEIHRMFDAVLLYVCQDCEAEHYFRADSLPGGDEHCEYCEHCSGLLIST